MGKEIKLEVKKKTKVTMSRGCVYITTIPKIIAELAKIKKGQNLMWSYDGKKITVEPLNEHENN